MLIGANIKSALQGSLIWLSMAMVMALLSAAIFALCLAALYFYVAGIFVPAIAFVITAGGALVLVGLIAAVMWISSELAGATKKNHGSAAPEDLSQLLNSALLGQLAAWVKANPKTATAAGALAGIGVGLSPELRQLLLGILGQRGNPPPTP